MESQDDPREIHLRTWNDEKSVWFSVQDTGPGIPESLRERIFEAFFTTKGTKGTGLGLAVVKYIMSKHDGEVFLDDSGLQGAQFALRFPITREIE